MYRTALGVSAFLLPLALALSGWKSELKLWGIPLVMRFSNPLTMPAQCRFMVLAPSTTCEVLLWLAHWR